jgi:hypothetical protein
VIKAFVAFLNNSAGFPWFSYLENRSLFIGFLFRGFGEAWEAIRLCWQKVIDVTWATWSQQQIGAS